MSSRRASNRAFIYEVYDARGSLTLGCYERRDDNVAFLQVIRVSY